MKTVPTTEPIVIKSQCSALGSCDCEACCPDPGGSDDLVSRRRQWRIPVYLGFGGVVIEVEFWTWRGLPRRFK